MSKLKNIFVLFLLLQVSNIATGQVEITPNYPDGGLFTAHQLYDVMVINSGAPVKGYLEVTIMLNGIEPVLSMTSFGVTLDAGMVVSGYDIKWQQSIEYGTNDASFGFRQSGLLPSGRYIFCYRFIAFNGSMLGQSCQEISISGFGPPELVFPYDRAELNTYPVLTWSPPALTSSMKGIKYHLKLVHLEEGQNPSLGLAQNFPMLELRGLRETHVLFSSDVGRLVEGEKYAWQIDASVDGFNLGRSSIWSFKFVDKRITESKELDKVISYNRVRSVRDSKYCLAKQALFFSYLNKYDEKILDYSISPISGKGVIKKDELPIFELLPGLNQLNLDCKRLGLEEEAMYLLTIRNKKGASFYLEFKALP